MGMNVNYMIYVGIVLDDRGFAGLPTSIKNLFAAKRFSDMNGIESEGLTFHTIPWYATDVSWQTGFGVVVHSKDDTHNEELDFEEIFRKIKAALPKVNKALKRWGIKEEARVWESISSCDWCQG